MERAYTVKEISLLLNTNAETVRRWIRDGQMKGDLNRGKKGGFTIKESDFRDFLRRHPKYKVKELADSDLSAFALAGLDQQIFRLEEAIAGLTHHLRRLEEIRESLL